MKLGLPALPAGPPGPVSVAVPLNRTRTGLPWQPRVPVIGNTPAPVATMNHNCARIIARMPDRRVTRVPLTWRLMPPIGRTRMVVTPDNDMVVPPVKIAIQPQPNRPADAEGDKGRAISSLIINLVRLINRHINHLRVSRNNFNVAAVINHLLLRRGLQVADIVEPTGAAVGWNPSRPAVD